jgi:predicted TIM-barrel fold metal-dependent hydrolase
MPDIQFFDANCQLGRFNWRIEGVPYDLAALCGDAREQGIARRLVYHAMAKEYSPQVGNDCLRSELAGHPELYPCWAVTTSETGEQARPAELLRQMQSENIRAVRFFRHNYAVPMADWSLGVLWSELAQHRVPLFLDVGTRWASMDEFDADEVWALCHAHPNLPVVLVKHRIRFNRQVYQLFEACPNLRMELSGYWHYRGIEELCRRFGPGRVLFGTNWPHMDSSFAVAAVMYAAVSDEDRAAVASGNLAALLEGVQW